MTFLKSVLGLCNMYTRNVKLRCFDFLKAEDYKDQKIRSSAVHHNFSHEGLWSFTLSRFFVYGAPQEAFASVSDIFHVTLIFNPPQSTAPSHT